MDNNIIVDSIKKLCKNKNITVSQLEKEIGLSQGLVSKWMNTTPSLDKIVDIAEYFHVSIDEVVGYKQNLKDEFLKQLYNRTENDSLSWESCETLNQNGSMVKQYSDFEMPGSYIGDGEKETSYATCFNNGYIVIYAYHRYNQIIHPYNLILFIQPNDNAYLVDQHYTKDELYSLWIKVLNHLGNNTPDEIKAEDLKNSFVNDKSTKTLDSYSDEQLKQITRNMIYMEPQLPKLFNAINDPEFMKLFNMIQNPNLKQNLELAQKLSPYYAIIEHEK